ncbi:MAG TPA: SpaA isopeptide-forming pilin-related protein [Bacillota bacterium]|jgi:uncharacterized surface anchored protein|nr:SpaA isopeptide-forming pilin-related protein [Bacillota bacterium]HQB81207.1 SpaA isopeptide-forming pilin-related protein [Bacillota bacterium]
MDGNRQEKKKAGKLAAVLAVTLLAVCFTLAGRSAPVSAYTAGQRKSLSTADLSTSRERILKSAAAHVTRANQVGYGYNRVLNGDQYLPLASSSQGFCCVDLVTHVVYTSTAVLISGRYHSIEETLAAPHHYSASNGLVFNTQTVSTLKSQLQAIPALYASLGAGVNPSSLKLGDIVLMGDRDGSALNHSVLVLGEITSGENAHMKIPGFNAKTSYFINMSSATGATYQSTDRFNKAWSAEAPNKGYFIKAAYRPLFDIKQQDLGGFSLKKTDALTGAGLPGAVFRLTDPDGTSRQISMVSSEYLSNKEYRPGVYTLQEISAPRGYLLDPSAHTLIIRSDEINETYRSNPLKNSPDKGKIEISKKDAVTGAAIKGTVFEVSQFASFPASATLRLTTGTDGTATSPDLMLSEGVTAYVREVSVPAPYLLDTQVRQAVLRRSQTVTLALQNDRAQGRLSLNKTCSLTGKPLEGVVFEIRDRAGGLIDCLITDQDGLAESGALPLGSYQLIEREAAKGYLADERPKTFDLAYEDMVTPLVSVHLGLDNQPIRGAILIEKLEKESGVPIPGAVFEILDEEGEPVLDYEGEGLPLLVSDGEGRVRTPDLRCGRYQIREVENPETYYLNEEVYEVSLVLHEEVVKVMIPNEKVQVRIQIRKFDEESLEPLQGAVFEVVKNGEGSPPELVASGLVTDEKGQATTDRFLPVGDYRLLETCPPEGYSSGEDLCFQITRETGSLLLERGGQAMVLQVGNKPVELEVSKRGTEGGQELGGAELQLIDKESGQLLEEWISSGEPHRITRLTVHRAYVLEEKKAPPGYALAEALNFSVEDSMECQQLVMQNELTCLLIKKLDQETGAPLSGAGFQVQSLDGQALFFSQDPERGVYTWAPHTGNEGQAALESNREGEVEIRGLPAGSYRLLEVKAPHGYNRPPQTLSFTLPPEATAADPCTLQLPNRQSEVILTKIDAMTGKALAGARLNVFNECGETIISGTTDKKGQIILAGLAPGKYEVREETAPRGYQKSEELLLFSLDEFGETKGELILKNLPQKAPSPGASPIIPCLIPALAALAGGVLLLMVLTRKYGGKREDQKI